PQLLAHLLADTNAFVARQAEPVVEVELVGLVEVLGNPKHSLHTAEVYRPLRAATTWPFDFVRVIQHRDEISGRTSPTPSRARTAAARRRRAASSSRVRRRPPRPARAPAAGPSPTGP